jgi:tetratricopeptide (TPR) repeat protein
VRETVGLVAYRAGEWAEAIGELRAARRMGGGPGHLAVMADCERALGHPERAIELSRSAEADDLDPDAAAELSIVVAGARADLGQIDAALAHLERVGLDKAEEHPRLAYAYADLLLQAGRRAEALGWFIRSANSDADEETDALDRVEAMSLEDAQAADSDTPELVDNRSDLELGDQVPAEQRPTDRESAEWESGEQTPIDDVPQPLADQSDAPEPRTHAPEPGTDAPEPGTDAPQHGTDAAGLAADAPELAAPAPGDDAPDSQAITDAARPGLAATWDGLLGDDDLEFKPASVLPATTGESDAGDSDVSDTSATEPAPSVTDDTEVPSLLFSDEPQAGDR